MAKKNVQFGELLKWNEYVGKSPADALPEIYLHATTVSKAARTWYWHSIKTKRISSLCVRGVTFALLVCGAILPILAALYSRPEIRLQFTQLGVATLAVAGLLQVADRVFGWSTGWLRYMTTVTAMEDLTRKFELDWANYIISKTDNITDNDKKPLFDLAKGLEDGIAKLQSDETDKWVTEFTSSIALLGELIKSQRESAEKTSETARLAVATQQTAAEAKEKAQQPGAIELTIIHKTEPVAIKVAIDKETEESFTGTVWSKLGLAPGLHEVRVTTMAKTPLTMKQPVDVPAGGIGKLRVELP